MRVHDLAKNLDISSKELIALMNEVGIEGKTHSSGLEPDQVKKIESRVKGDKTASKPAAKASKTKSSGGPGSQRSSASSTPSSRTSTTGTAGKTAGFDRKSRVQRMLIQRKLARRQKATPSPEKIEEPEITIQVIEEKEKPKPTPSP